MSTVASPYTLTWGRAEINLVHDGELDVPGERMFNGLPHAEWAGLLAEPGGGLVTSPVTVVLLRLGGETILLDTGIGEESGVHVRGGATLATLAALGVAPEAVTRVVISHAHGDHIWGAVRSADGRRVPTFPNARYHLPRPDWDWLRQVPDSPGARLLGVVEAAGQLVLDDPDGEVVPGLLSIDTAGHSPGHRCLALEAGGRTFCFLGDLTHVPALHFARPDCVTAFDHSPALTPPARRRLAERAVDGDWLLAGAHAAFPSLGRLTPAGPDSWTWRPVAE